MKNFEDILKTEHNTEEVTTLNENSNEEFEKTEVDTADALAKFKNHKRKKKQDPSSRRKFVQTIADEEDIETIEEAIEVVSEVPESDVVDPTLIKKQSPQRIKITAVPVQTEVEDTVEIIVEESSSPEGQLAFSINMDVLGLVDEVSDVQVEESTSAIEAVVEPVSEEDKVVSEVVENPTEIISEDSTVVIEGTTIEEPIVVVEPKKVVVQPIVATPSEVTEEIETTVENIVVETTETVQEVVEEIISDEVQPVEETQSVVSEVQAVEEIPSDESVEVKPKKVKKGFSSFSKLKRVEYKTALKVFVGAVAVVIIAIAVIALSKGINIVPVKTDEVNTVKIQPNNQVVVIESDGTILFKKSLNEGLPVNYYSLLNTKSAVEVPSGYVSFEDIYSTTIPNLVTTTEVNGREHNNTAVFSTWAIKAKDNTILESNHSLIKDIIAITLEGKDSKFFSSEAMMSQSISFAVERTTGEAVEVKNLQVLNNFKK